MKKIFNLIKEHKLLFIIWIIFIVSTILKYFSYNQSMGIKFLIQGLIYDSTIIIVIGCALNSDLFSKPIEVESIENLEKKEEISNDNDISNTNKVEIKKNKKIKKKRKYKKGNIIIAIGIILLSFEFIFVLSLTLLQILLQGLFAKTIHIIDSFVYSFLISKELLPISIIGIILIIIGILIKIIKKD